MPYYFANPRALWASAAHEHGQTPACAYAFTGTLFEAEWDNRLRRPSRPRGIPPQVRALHLDGAALFRLGVQLYSRINTSHVLTFTPCFCVPVVAHHKKAAFVFYLISMKIHYLYIILLLRGRRRLQLISVLPLRATSQPPSAAVVVEGGSSA